LDAWQRFNLFRWKIEPRDDERFQDRRELDDL
jgi:hypothetical protein